MYVSINCVIHFIFMCLFSRLTEGIPDNGVELHLPLLSSETLKSGRKEMET